MMLVVGYNNRDDRSSDRRNSPRRDFGRKSFGGNRGPVEMHDAVCSNCGKPCKVPFLPNGSKPVFCNDCFKRDGDSRPNRFSERSNDRPHFESRYDNRNESRPPSNTELNAINQKLDKILDLLTSKE